MKFNNLIITGLCCIIALFSCKKDDNQNIGATLVDNPNKISAVVESDFDFITYSEKEDSVTTSNFSELLVGSIHSEEAGTASSYVYFTLTPDSFDRTFPSSDFYIENFTLEIELNESYGTSDNNEFDVFMTQNYVSSLNSYYNFDSLALGEQLGSFTLNLGDSGLISIPLDSAMGTKLMTDDPSLYTSYDQFISLFPGICIKPKNEVLPVDEGAIFTIKASSPKINFSFKTTNDSDELYDTEIQYSSPGNEFIFSRFKHNLSGSALEAIINDTTNGQNSFIVQGMAGGFGKIEFPDFEEWYFSDTANYLLSNFKLTFFASPDNTFELPDSLVISYNSSATNSHSQFIKLDSENNSYSIEILTSNITDALNEGYFNDMNFRLRVPNQRKKPDVLTLDGPLGIQPPKLEVIATKY